MDANNNLEPQPPCAPSNKDDPVDMLFDNNERDNINSDNDGGDDDDEEVPTHLLASSHHSNLSYIGDMNEDFHPPCIISSCPTPTGSNNFIIDNNNRSSTSMMEEYKNSIYNRLESFEEQLQNELQCLEEAYYDHDVEINDDTDDDGYYDDYSTRPIVGRKHRKKRGGQQSSSYKQHPRQLSSSSIHNQQHRIITTAKPSSSSSSRGQRRLSGKRLVKLSHKTNEILTNYQTYLAEIETLDNDNNNDEEDVITADDKNHTPFNHHHPAAGDDMVYIEHLNDHHNVAVVSQQLHREWNYYNKQNNTNIAAIVAPPSYDDEYDMADHGNSRRGYNKIVKRGITIVVAIGIICIGIGIMAGMNNNSKINAPGDNKSINTPGSDNHHQVTIGKEETVGGDGVLEHKFIDPLLDEEESEEDDILGFGATAVHASDSTAAADTGSTGGVTSSSSSIHTTTTTTYHTSDIDNVSASTTASGMPNKDGSSDVDNVAHKGTSFMAKVVNDVYYNSIKRYQPTMYNRSKGWQGQTYMDALVFCSKKGLAVCPYDAICPNGMHGEPLGGYRDGSSGDWEWLPIVDDYNEWVQGSAREKCVKYSHKYSGKKPAWGVTKSDDDGNAVSTITENIMCCVNVM